MDQKKAYALLIILLIVVLFALVIALSFYITQLKTQEAPATQETSATQEASIIQTPTGTKEDITNTIAINNYYNYYCPDSCDDNNKCTNDLCSEETNFMCVNNQKVPCCGNDICENGENKTFCFDDCNYIPNTNENVISEGNIYVVYNKKLSKEYAEYLLGSTKICIKYLKDKLKIDLPDTAKNKFVYVKELIGDNEKTYSYARFDGITGLINMVSYNKWIVPNLLKLKTQNKQNICNNLHEMTHVFVGETQIPPWADEGLATYSEKEFYVIIDNSYPAPIECREKGWYGSGYYGDEKEYLYSDLSSPPGKNGEPGSHWYYTGYCFWKLIEEKYGQDTIISILQELKKQGTDTKIDFFKDIVNPIIGEDITPITKARFNVP